MEGDIMNNDTTYKSSAISSDILEVLDVTAEGKVVSASDWKQLWNTVFNSINSIDAYCITVDTLLLDYKGSQLEMLARLEAMRIKYDALAAGFVHYGEEPPTNKHIQFWVKPVAGPGGPDDTVFATMADLAKKVTKFDRMDNTFKYEVYHPELTNADTFKLKQYRTSEDVTSFGCTLSGENFFIGINWPYTIPKDTNVTVMYARGVSGTDALGRAYYPARITVLLDSAWILRAGTQGAPGMMTACHGYLTVDYTVTEGTVLDKSTLVPKFHKTADVNISRTASVVLSTDKWSQSTPYSQSVSLSNITANSKIDLTPTPTQLNDFCNKGHYFVVENKNKVVTVYCIGNKPTVNYTIPATITEVAT